MPFRYLELNKDEYNAIWILVPGPLLTGIFGVYVTTGKERFFLPVTIYTIALFYFANTLWRLIYRVRTEEEKTYWPPRSDIHGRFGRLIVFEGLDGAGKTTQVANLTHLLRKSGYPMFSTTWSALQLGTLTTNGLVKLTPKQISDLHLNYFKDRHEEILAALDDGQVVICDRYFYTALARDKSRGIEKARDYSFAVTPDIILFLDVEPETAVQRVLQRIAQSRMSSDSSMVETLSFYEAGHDLNLDPDINENFKKFHARTAQHYWKLMKDYDMVTLNSLESVKSLGSQIEKLVRPLLPPEEAYKHNSKKAIAMCIVIIVLYIPVFMYVLIK